MNWWPVKVNIRRIADCTVYSTLRENIKITNKWTDCLEYEFFNCTFENDFLIISEKITSLNFDKCSLKKLIIKKNTNLKEIKLNRISWKWCDIIIANNYNIKNITIGDVEIKKNRIWTLKISKTFSSEEKWLIILYNIYANKIHIDSINTPHKFAISWIDTHKLHFKEVDFWDSIFNNSTIWEFYLNWSNISNMSLNNLNFETYSLWNNYYSETLNNINLKDNYRQLKFVMDKNGNYTEANKFFAKEMEYYGKSLDWKNNKFEKFIFEFQKIISDFWNSWIRPLVFLSIVILLKTLKDIFNYKDKIQYIIQTLNNPFEILWDFLNKYAQNFLVFHEIYKDWWIWFIDTVLNIIAVILIYHIIIAFKRTTKR